MDLDVNLILERYRLRALQHKGGNEVSVIIKRISRDTIWTDYTRKKMLPALYATAYRYVERFGINQLKDIARWTHKNAPLLPEQVLKAFSSATNTSQ